MRSNEAALASRDMAGANGCDGRKGHLEVVKNEFASGTHDAIAINLNMVVLIEGVNVAWRYEIFFSARTEKNAGALEGSCGKVLQYSHF